MTFIILDPYQRENSVGCVEISPIDRLEESNDHFYINSDICIDLGTFVPVCLVDASFDEYDLTPDQEIYLESAENFYGR